MYLKKMFFKNYGPIDELDLDIPFDSDGNPKPLILVGGNGSGKTILLSSIVDSFYELLNKLFDDVLIKSGSGYKYYKIPGGPNLMIGKEYCFCGLKFSIDERMADYEYIDCFGNFDLKTLYPKIGFSVMDSRSLNKSKFTTDFSKEINSLRNVINNGAYFYMPANRFENPFWKSYLYYDDSYKEHLNFNDIYNKPVEVLNSYKDNIKFLLDLVLDYLANRDQIDIINWNNINTVIKQIKDNPNIRFGVNKRTDNSRLSIGTDIDNNYIPILRNISQLSLGESLLLYLFINILRLSDKPNNRMEEIKGIVVIDEADVHLHINLQRNVLPKLIQLFPKVQFILTTHSPMFLLGMEKTFGSDGFQIIEMPNGNQITCERFSEFQTAYDAISTTKIFEDSINKLIDNGNSKPILFVEGPSDITYLEKAFEIHDKKDIFEKINFKPIGSAPKNGSTRDSSKEEMHKVKNFFVHHPEATNKKLIFLFDPEENVEEEEKENKIFVIKHKKYEDNHIKRGIENYFPSELIEKIYRENKEFIQNDIHITDGIQMNDQYKIKNGQKARLAEWICQNCTDKDFNLFSDIITEIEKIIKK